MREVDVNEAGKNFDALLQEVAEGGEVMITRAGIPVAVVKSVRLSEIESERRSDAVEKLLELRKGRTLGPDVSIRDLIEEGRRF